MSGNIRLVAAAVACDDDDDDDDTAVLVRRWALWMRVFSKSNGWKSSVEHEALNEPARKDLSMAC